MTLTRSNLRVKFCDYNFSFLRCFSPCVWPCALQTSLPPSMWWAVCLTPICTWYIASFHFTMTWPWVKLYKVEQGLFGALLVGWWCEDPCYATWGDIRLCLQVQILFFHVLNELSMDAKCKSLPMSRFDRELSYSEPRNAFCWRQAAINDDGLSIDNVLSDT